MYDHPAGEGAGQAASHAASNGHSHDPLQHSDYPLLEHHRRMLLEDRALSWAAIIARGTRSVESGIELRELGFPSMPTPGILIPIHPLAGLLAGEQPIYAYRPDTPPDPKRKYYWMAGVKARLDLPPLAREWLRDPTRVRYFVEGWLKADALASAGVCAIALLGTSAFGWKPEPGLPILRDWEALPLAGTLSRIIFDSDTTRKDGVALSRMRLTTVLRGRGSEVQWTELPDHPETGAKLGADDWRALGHDVAELDALSSVPEREPYVTAPLDDIGNGQRFVYGNADRAAWSPARKIWLTWDGRRWDSVNQERALRFAQETAREAQLAAVQLPDAYANRDVIIRHALKLASHSTMKTMLEQAKPLLAVDDEEFDQQPMKLTVLNGTVDLSTGALLAHSPEDRITKLAPVVYDSEAELGEWTRFLHTVTAGVEGLEAFLLRALGYSITGDTREERLFMPIGPPRSGKTTLVEAVAATLGDYAVTASFSSFLKGDHETNVREDIARLAGARFVSASEVDEGQSLSEALVKQLTGSDRIAARHLFQGTFQFVPQLHLWLVANDEPRVTSKNEAMWERILRLPFDHYLRAEERDQGLKARLRDPAYAGPAILASLVRGCLEWQAVGLMPPATVASATREYRARMDPLTGWLEEECVQHDGAEFPVADAYPAYILWATKNGLSKRERLGRNGFAQAMEQRGFVKRQGKGKGAWHWAGVGPVASLGRAGYSQNTMGGMIETTGN